MNRRVLFVEDEHLLRVIYRRQTSELFDVEIVAGPAEALGTVAGREFAVVVTDRSMPDMDGLQLAENIRQLDPRPVLILLTAHPDKMPDELPPDLLFRVLTKPCPRNVLLKTLEEALEEYRERAATTDAGQGSPRSVA